MTSLTEAVHQAWDASPDREHIDDPEIAQRILALAVDSMRRVHDMSPILPPDSTLEQEWAACHPDWLSLAGKIAGEAEANLLLNKPR